MGTEPLVEELIDDGHQLLVELTRIGHDISAAALVKDVETGRCRLFVGLVAPEKENARVYHDLFGLLQRFPDLKDVIPRVMILPAAHPIIHEYVDLRNRNLVGRLLPWFGDTRFGDPETEEVYVYPRITSGLTREEVLQTVTGLLRQTAPVRPSLLTLRDGTVIRGEPYGLEVNRAGGAAVLAVKVRDTADGSARTIPADDVANIQ